MLVLIYVFILLFDISVRLAFEPEKYLEELEDDDLSLLQNRIDHLFQGGIITLGFIITGVSALIGATQNNYPFELLSDALFLIFLMIPVYFFTKRRRIGFTVLSRLFGYAIFSIFMALSSGFTVSSTLDSLFQGSMVWIYLGYILFILEPAIKAKSQGRPPVEVLREKEDIFDNYFDKIIEDFGLSKLFKRVKNQYQLTEGMSWGVFLTFGSGVAILFVLLLAMMPYTVNWAMDQTQTVDPNWNNSVENIYYVEGRETHKIKNQEPEYRELKEAALLQLDQRFSKRDSQFKQYCEPQVDRNDSIVLETEKINLSYWSREEREEIPITADKFTYYLTSKPMKASCLQIEGQGFFPYNEPDLEEVTKDLSRSDYTKSQ